MKPILTDPLASAYPTERPTLRLVKGAPPPAHDGVPAGRADGPREPFCLMPSVIVRDYAKRIGMTALGVYLALADHADREAACWPSVETIAEMLGLSETTVRKAIRVLAEHGLVEVERRRDELGRDRSHLFRLPKHCTYRGQNLTPRGQILTFGGSDSDPEPYSVEPDLKETTTRAARARESSSSFRPSYCRVLNGLYDDVRDGFREMAPELNEGWLRTTMAEVEQEIGPVREDQLVEALKATMSAMERTLLAERGGGKRVGALGPYVRSVFVAQLRAQLP